MSPYLTCIPERGKRPAGLVKMWIDQVRENRVFSQPDEIGDSVGFVIFVYVRISKCRITLEPEELELLPVLLHNGLDKIERAVR